MEVVGASRENTEEAVGLVPAILGSVCVEMCVSLEPAAGSGLSPLGPISLPVVLCTGCLPVPWASSVLAASCRLGAVRSRFSIKQGCEQLSSAVPAMALTRCSPDLLE